MVRLTVVLFIETLEEARRREMKSIKDQSIKKSCRNESNQISSFTNSLIAFLRQRTSRSRILIFVSPQNK